MHRSGEGQVRRKRPLLGVPYTMRHGRWGRRCYKAATPPKIISTITVQWLLTRELCRRAVALALSMA